MKPLIAEIFREKLLFKKPGTGKTNGPRLLFMTLILSVLLFTVACGKEETAGDPTVHKKHPLIAEGLKYLEEGDTEKALMTLQELMNREKNNTDGMVALCKVFIKQGRYPDATQWANKALKIDSNLAGPYDILGEVYFRTSRIDQALESSRKALIMDPTLPNPYLVIGTIYLKKGKARESIKVFKEALRLKPRDTRTLEKLSAAYIKIKDYERAVPYLKEAHEINPELPGVHFNLATAYANLNEGQKAMEHIRKAELLYQKEANSRWVSQARHKRAVITEMFKMRPEDIVSH